MTRKSRKSYARRDDLGAAEYDILSSISAGDLLVGMLFSARNTRRMYQIARERGKRRLNERRTLRRLFQKGFLVEDDGKLLVSEKGNRALATVIQRLAGMSARNTRWDGKWRIVAFDIPETMRVSRDKLRNVLRRSGFKQLQQSVWVFPHECGELTVLLRTDSRLASRVVVAVSDSVQTHLDLRSLFRLPKRED